MTATKNSAVRVHQGRVFDLVTENITLENGVTIDLDLIRHPGAAAIVPMIDRGKVVLIEQYRYAIGNYIWEIPAGTMDAGESPAQCAGRELIEETGYSAGNMQKLGEITPVPGYSDERIHLFLAMDLKPATRNPDKDELMHVREVELDEAIQMIYSGRIQDAKTIVGLFLADSKLKILL